MAIPGVSNPNSGAISYSVSTGARGGTEGFFTVPGVLFQSSPRAAEPKPKLHLKWSPAIRVQRGERHLPSLPRPERDFGIGLF